MAWSTKDIPPPEGKRFLVTGGNTGIGYHEALQLALHGGDVTIACRSEKRAKEAVARMAERGVDVDFVPLDLADLDSVDACAKQVGSLDVLINNAGVMAPPLKRTAQGFELQWGVNVVGHARLTMALLDRITDRVVTVSSIAHRRGRIDFEDLRGEKPYDAWRSYAQSKLGNLVFALELDRRLKAAGSSVRSVAAHPGTSRTELGRHLGVKQILGFIAFLPFLQSAARGAEPVLRAATDDVPGGSYWGPAHFREKRGPAVEARMEPHATDEELGRRLWAELQKGLPGS